MMEDREGIGDRSWQDKLQVEIIAVVRVGR